ncbi:MAG: threonine synthase [Sphaerochaetaceae bacterium]
MQYRCNGCHTSYSFDKGRYKCDCGGLLQIEYPKKPLDFASLATCPERSLWRYAKALPPISWDIIQKITMGEGGTPLIRLEKHLWGKADYFMPTLSFKDRGAVVLVAAMSKLGVKHCIIDSSGNAGTAIAAYSARANISCEVFVPIETNAQKIAQIEAYQATIHRIEGGREATAQAALDRVELTHAFYASHVYNPLFWEGTKTYLYEIFEQCEGNLPQVLVVPVGNGTLLMGLTIALEELKSWGFITKFPLVVAVQAANCDPLAKASSRGLPEVPPINNKPTVADGIAITHPLRETQILEALRFLRGTFITVTEEQILFAQRALALRGVFVEKTSAVNYAGYLNMLEQRKELKDVATVIPLCGSGLKSF